MFGKNGSKGFSLVEMMVALGVAGLVLAGLLTGYLVQKRSSESEYNVRDMEIRAQIAMDHVKRIVRNAGFGCEGSFREGGAFQGCETEPLQSALTVKEDTPGQYRVTVVTAWPLRAFTHVVGLVPDGEPWCETLDACYTSTRVAVEDASPFDTAGRRYVYIPTIDNTFREIVAIGASDGTDVLTFASPVRALPGQPVYPVSAYTIEVREDEGEDTHLFIDESGLDGCSSDRIAAFVDDLRFELLGANMVRIWMLFRSEKPDRGFREDRDQIQLAGHAFDLYQPDYGNYHRRLLVETVLVRNQNL